MVRPDGSLDARGTAFLLVFAAAMPLAAWFFGTGLVRMAVGTPTLVQVIVLLVAFVLLAFFLLFTTYEPAVRFAFYGATARVFWLQFAFALSVLASVLLLAVADFAALTCSLGERGLVAFDFDFSNSECQPQFANYYFWHFAHTVPGLEIPKTLLWDEPFRYTDQRAGYVLLTYKAVFILPIIAVPIVWRRVIRAEHRRLYGGADGTADPVSR